MLLFPGQWGREDKTTLAGRVMDKNHGPLSPSCQSLWIDPLWTIFCKAHWEGPANRCHGRRQVKSPNPCNGDFPESGPDYPLFG
jgi:hypothetical protein